MNRNVSMILKIQPWVAYHKEPQMVHPKLNSKTNTWSHDSWSCKLKNTSNVYPLYELQNVT
jgi:hypothetical protein